MVTYCVKPVYMPSTPTLLHLLFTATDIHVFQSMVFTIVILCVRSGSVIAVN